MPMAVAKDTVLMYHFPRGSTIPSPSPFALKLETYLRMAEIKYKSDLSGKLSKKGKIPWIVVDGEVVNDTAFIIQHLNKKFDIDLNKHLSSKEKAISYTYTKTMEENTFWATITYGRFAENFSWFLGELGVPKIAFPIAKLTLRRRIMKSMWGHGIGRHSSEDIRKLGEEDLEAFSKFLDNKPFFMGDKPSLIDATMFGFLAELLWFMPPDHWTTKAVKEDYQNLASYCERMRTKYWPDWNDNLKNANKPTKF